MSNILVCKQCQRYTSVNEDRICDRCLRRPELKRKIKPKVIYALIRKIAFGVDVHLKGVSGWRENVYYAFEEDRTITRDEWESLRLKIISRDKRRCRRCGKRFDTKSLTVHHIIPRIELGSNSPSNLITLCVPCHDFVEMSDLRSISDIRKNFKIIPDERDEKQVFYSQIVNTQNRHDWHTWVYGGARRQN